MKVIFRIRTIIAAVAGVLAIAVPAGTASAATPTAPSATSGPFTSPDAGALIAPYRAGLNAALDSYQTGAQSVLDGWTADANSAFNNWQMGLQRMQDAANTVQAANQQYTQNLQTTMPAGSIVVPIR